MCICIWGLFTDFSLQGVVFTGVLSIIFLFKYTNFRPWKGRGLKKAKEFYNSLTKKEKDTMKSIWGIFSFNDNPGPAGYRSSFVGGLKLKKLPSNFNLIRQQIKKKIKEDEEIKKSNAKKRADNKIIAINKAKLKAKKVKLKAKIAAAEAKSFKDKYKKYKNKLTEKYGSTNAAKIIKNQVWKDMNREMLIESQGNPGDIDETVYKTKTKTKYFYRPYTTRQNNTSYRFRVDLEDDIVVGWRDLD